MIQLKYFIQTLLVGAHSARFNANYIPLPGSLKSRRGEARPSPFSEETRPSFSNSILIVP